MQRACDRGLGAGGEGQQPRGNLNLNGVAEAPAAHPVEAAAMEARESELMLALGLHDPYAK